MLCSPSQRTKPANKEIIRMTRETHQKKMARPERFELPTKWFEATYSIQLSYGRKRRTELYASEAALYEM